MTTQLAPVGVQRFFDNAGLPAIGGLVYTYAAGTTTPQATYTDSTGLTANTNPIVLNTRGEARIWLTPGLYYKIVPFDALGNALPVVDNVSSDGGIFAAIAASVANLANESDPTKGAALVGYGTNTTVRDVLDREIWLGPEVGADPTGSLPSDNAWAAAITAAGSSGTVRLIDGATYRFNNAWVMGNVAALKCSGTATFKSYVSSGSADTFSTGRTDNGAYVVAGITFDSNNSGRDGLVVTNGDHGYFERCVASNANRDGLALHADGSAFIENGKFDITVNSAGRHGVRMELSGSGGSFINETEFDQLEIRGWGKKVDGGMMIYLTSSATSGASKFGTIRFGKMNGDAQYTAGPGVPEPSTTVIGIDSGNAENWYVASASIENTGGVALSGGPLIAVTGTGAMNIPWIQGIVVSNIGEAGLSGVTDPDFFNTRGGGVWIAGKYTGPLRLRNSRIWEDDTAIGAQIKKIRLKSADPASEGDGTTVSGVDIGVVSLGASSSGSIVVPGVINLTQIANATDLFPHDFIVTLAGSQGVSSGSRIMRSYHVIVLPDQGTCIASQISDASTSSALSAVVFSGGSGALTAAITTGSGWAGSKIYMTVRGNGMQ